MKINYGNILRTQDAYQTADLIAIRIEATESYIIKKCRSLDCSLESFNPVSEAQFKIILSYCKRPLVFSDSYLDMEDL